MRPASPGAAGGAPRRLLHAGVGLRHAHHAQALRPVVHGPIPAFVEVHAENFFGDGGAALHDLDRARATWPVSLHGVGLALGSAAGLDPWHLDRLERLVRRIDPVRVSDHACAGRAVLAPGAPVHHACDLLPIAFTPASLAIMVQQVQQVQDRLRRPILVENLAAYLGWVDDSLDEADFLDALARRSGCGLLLDVNNLVVNARNRHPGDAPAALAEVCAWIDRLHPDSVGEIHLAGHAEPQADLGALCIDDHGAPVAPLVWQAFALAIGRLGARPTLIEWDHALPSWGRLLAEAARAEAGLQACSAPCAALHTLPASADRGQADPAALPVTAAGRPQELLRQQWLQRALWGQGLGAQAAGWLQGSAERRQRGLRAYRANAAATAERALAAAYPTVQQLLGGPSFAMLAQAHWHAQAPERGDLAAWGAGLPAAVSDDPQLAAEPYLADVARLDWLVHLARAAADDDAPVQGLDLLAHSEPDLLLLRLRDGHAVLQSQHAVHSVWQAHQEGSAAGFGVARQALAAGRAEQVRVSRQGMHVLVQSIDAGTAAFELCLLAGVGLGTALTGAGPGFDFTAWLVEALRREAIAAIRCQRQAPPP